MKCPKCATDLLPGKALEQTFKPGIDGPGLGATMVPGGAGNLVDVLKCPKCGYSTYIAADPGLDAAVVDKP